MTVWPYLLAGAAACAFWNWRAALMFALAVGVGQATARLDLPQLYLLAGYSILATVAILWIDQYSGFVLALFGLVIGVHIAGLIGHMPKIIAGEVLLFAGMLFCGINGPSGGLFSGVPPVHSSGPDPVSLGRSEAAEMPAQVSTQDQ